MACLTEVFKDEDDNVIYNEDGDKMLCVFKDEDNTYIQQFVLVSTLVESGLVIFEQNVTEDEVVQSMSNPNPTITNNYSEQSEKNVTEGEVVQTMSNPNPTITNNYSEQSEKNVTEGEVVKSISNPNPTITNKDSGQSTEKEQSEAVFVWNTTRPRPVDHQATEAFINLVMSETIQYLLKDKRTPKIKVWQQVYEEMVKLGFHVCEKNKSKDGGMKCNQKWRNLEKNYIDLKKNAGPKSTGKGRKDPPPYYNLLHAAFSDKHTVNPPVVLDTLNVSNLQNKIVHFGEDFHECDEGGSSSSVTIDSLSHDEEPPTKRFMKVKKTTKPINPILLEIQKQHAQDIEMQKEFMEVNRAMIAEQKEQTKILSQLITFMTNK